MSNRRKRSNQTAGSPGRFRLSTETKEATKTTELIFYLAAVAGLVITAITIDGNPDPFGADRVWLYITVLTVAYLLSRGLAKAGSYEPYDVDANESPRG
jgi:hypothetical protein